MLLYGVGRTSFTPQIRRHSSAGQSARFTSVRSWVQVPLSPPKEKGTERCLFLLVQRHLAQPNAARCGGDFRFALCVVFAEFAFGKLVSLPEQSSGNASFPHTRPLPFAGVAIQTDRLPQKRAPDWVPFSFGAKAGRVCFALCVVFAEFAFGKLVSLPERSPGNAASSASLYVWYLPSLPLANSLACQGFALAMLRQVERRSLRKVSVTVPSLASSGPE